MWERATRDVTRLRSKSKSVAPEPPPPAEIEARKAEPAPSRRAPQHPAPATGLDRRSMQRLKRGQTPIEAKLDLHGMIQAEAHEALARFIARCQAAGMRAVLVVTGKSGVLHGIVPRWLEEGANRARILAFARAQAQHGGAGALYVLLRRQR